MASQVQELVLLLLHQAKSPFVAADGFLDMVDLEKSDNQVVNRKLIDYAQSSSRRGLVILDLIDRLLGLTADSRAMVKELVRLDVVIDKAFKNNSAYQFNRVYRLPIVLADRHKLGDTIELMARLASPAGKSTLPVEINFRIRDEYGVLKFSSPTLAAALAIIKPVYQKNINLTAQAMNGQSDMIALGYILRHNIELMGGYVKVDAKRGQPLSLYIHLPICRQLQMSKLLEGTKVG